MVEVLFVFRDVGAEESEIRVGFVTYSKEIHFYNVKVGKNVLNFLFCLVLTW